MQADSWGNGTSLVFLPFGFFQMGGASRVYSFEILGQLNTKL